MRIKTYYFSPTGATLQVASHLAEALATCLGKETEYHSYTLPHERETLPTFEADDVVLWATPVYAGRIPNKTLDYVRRALHGTSCPAVALATFGNRAYDNALAELTSLMQEGGLKLVGAAAVVTRHAFSVTLGAGRPNADDLAALSAFAQRLAAKIMEGRREAPRVPGEAHPEKYYTPLTTNQAPAGFLKAKPSCDPSLCTRCGDCLRVCPMGSIAAVDGKPSFDGICIKCQACRRICPTAAIGFSDPQYLSHVAMIERTFADPKVSEFFC